MRFLSFVILILVITAASAQEKAVITVLNANDSMVLSEVCIHVIQKNKDHIYITDYSGRVVTSIQDSLIVKIQRSGFRFFEKLYIRSGDIKIYLTEDPSDLGSLVVTGQSETKEVQKAAQKISVIDQKKIQQLAAPTLKEALSNELNIRLSNDQFLGSAVSLRGVGGQNVKVLMDGIPIIGRENGNIDLSQIPLSNVDHIEIVEGPMSVNYGSDAIGGVINIITKKPAGRKLQGGTQFYHESAGRYNIDFRGGISKNRVAYNFDAGRYFFGGFDSITDSRKKLWKPKTQLFTTHQLSFRTGKEGVLRLQFYKYFEKISGKGDVYITPYEAYAFDQYYYTSRNNVTLFYDRKIRNFQNINIVAGWMNYNRIKTSVRKDMVSLSEILTYNPDDQDTSKFNTWMSRGTFQFNAGKRKQFQSGYEIQIDQAEGSKISGSSKSIADVAFFTNAEWKAGKKWLIRPGFRWSYNTKYGAPFVPALQLKFDLNSTTTLRGSYARGFRAPSLKELYLYFVDANHNIIGNPDLKAEQSNSFSLNLDYKDNIKRGYIRLDGAFFYNQLTNMITLVITDPLVNEYKYSNAENFLSTGVSGNVSLKYKYLQTGVGFSYTGFHSTMAGTKLSSFSPEIRGQTTYHWSKIKTEFSLFYKYNGKLITYQLADDGKSIKTNVTGFFQMLDFTINRSWLKNKIQVSTGIKNIFDVKNVNGNLGGGAHTGSTTQIPVGYGRFFFVSFKLNIS